MRRAIDTAPRDGEFVILEDDVSGSFELAQWSAEARGWVKENGEPSKIAPTHWQTTHLPQQRDQVILQDKSIPQKETGLNAPSPSRGPRSFVFPAGLAARAKVEELTRLVANADLSLSSELEVRAALGKSAHRARRWFAVSIAAVMVGTAVIGWYFHTELADYLMQYGRTATGGVAVVETPIPSQDSQKAGSAARDPALHQQADRASSQAQSLENERRGADAPANEQMAKISQAVETATAELRQSLQKERDRAEALAGELTKAKREIEAQVALTNKVGGEATQLKQLKEAAETSMAELRPSLQPERDGVEAPAAGREHPQQTTRARIAGERASNSQVAEVKQQAAAIEPPATAEAQGSAEAARLLARASALIGQGNIGAARIVLERAVETGSPQASFMLAETYDPLVLSTWKTYGTQGDVTKARELYAKALAGGIEQAKDRSVALH